MNSQIKTELQNLLNESNQEKPILYLEEQISKYPNDPELIFYLVLYLCRTSVYGNNSRIALNAIDKFSKANNLTIEIILLKVSIELNYLSKIGIETLIDVEKVIKNNPNNNLTKYFFHLLGLHYSLNCNDKAKSIFYFKKSIELDPTASSNYYCLGKALNSSYYLKQSIVNITQTFDETDPYDPFSFEDYINESIRGILVFKGSIGERKMEYKKMKRNETFSRIKKWLFP